MHRAFPLVLRLCKRENNQTDNNIGNNNNMYSYYSIRIYISLLVNHIDIFRFYFSVTHIQYQNLHILSTLPWSCFAIDSGTRVLPIPLDQ